MTRHAGPIPDGYLERSRLPLQAMFFLLPFVVIYELGTLIYATDYAHGVTQHIKARLVLLGFFEWFGVGGYMLPGLIVIAALLGWHIAAKDRWEFEPKLYLLMLGESIMLAVPLLFFMSVMSRGSAAPHYAVSMQAVGGGVMGGAGAAAVSVGAHWQAEAIFSIGAGIYEELLFRMVAIALLHLLLVDVLALPDLWGSIIAIALSSAAFAYYHFSAAQPFDMTRFLLYGAAGVYLACVFIVRGFGVAAGTHAMYDLLIVALKILR